MREMRVMTRSRSVVVALAVAGLACGGATEPVPACLTLTSLAVTGGATPTIGWTPECGVKRIVVREVVEDSPGIALHLVRWDVDADDGMIAPPVRYGRRPARTTVYVSPMQLERGRVYAVDVYINRSPGPAASQTFTP
jgi:hypothetical protein